MYQLIGAILSIIAFGYWGKGMVNRDRAKDFRPFMALLLVVLTIGFHVLIPADKVPDLVSFGGRFLDQLMMALMNFGIALLIDAGYLKAKKFDNPKVYWVPGAFSLLLALVLFIFSQTYLKVNAWLYPAATTPTTYMVELGADDEISEVETILKKYGATYEKAFPSISLSEDEDLAQYYLVTVPQNQGEALMVALKKDTENIDSAEPNGIIQFDDPKATQLPETTAKFSANDPLLPRQWYAEKLEYEKCYQMLASVTPKRKAKVAILDTGVDSDHEDIKGVFEKSPSSSDQHGHGTHCAGLAGAVTNNGKGIGSLNWEGKFIEIRGYAALSPEGSGSYETISQAIIDAAKGNADVISMSLGGPAPFGAPKVMKDAVKYATKQNAIVIVAAGNSNLDAGMFSPANIAGVICVGATNPELGKAPFSNTNTRLKMPIASPGMSIFSATPGNQYVAWDGTSMATPIVAGLVGVMRSIQPDLKTEDAYKILNKTGLAGADANKIGKTIQPAAVLAQILD